MAKPVRFLRESQNEFQKVFSGLCNTRSSWQVWDDFISISAICLDPKGGEREKEYAERISKYKPEEQKVFPMLFGITVQALEREPEQDFLGEMFMGLELSSHWHGQFFTPYSVCQMMAKMSMQDAAGKIEKRGWIGIQDPAVGAGALLIAARNQLNHPDILGSLPGHLRALFVGQDISRTAGLMAFIQLSLLGCAGYIVIADSIRYPMTSINGNPLLFTPQPEQEYWFMPMTCDPVWIQRRRIAFMGMALGAETKVGGSTEAEEPEAREEPQLAEAAKLPEPEEVPAKPEPEPAFSGIETKTGQFCLF